MNKYIDAELLRERIENLKIKVYGCESNTDSDVIVALVSFDIVLRLIDSLQQEQQEVDLEKEMDNYIGSHFSEAHDGVLLSDASGMELTITDIAPIARHFYELGLKARKEEKK